METIEAAKTKYHNLSKEELLGVVDKLTLLLQSRDHRIALLEHFMFSSKKERFVADPAGMRNFFNETEEEASTEEQADKEVDTAQETVEVKGHKKRRGKRKPLPEHLPRQREEIDLPEADKVCKEHKVPLVKIGEEVVEKLEIIPAKSYVLQKAYLKYKCPCCSEENDKDKIFGAGKEPDPIPKSFATPSLLAYIVTAKFEDALPLYRQEKIFARYGIDLDRTTMARWVICIGKLAQPLLNLLHEDALDSAVVNADETTVQVLGEENRPAEQKSYMWSLARSYDKPIILFRYFTTRGKAAAIELLSGYSGIVVCDAYKAYPAAQNHGNFTLAGCLAHGRRKFWTAEKCAKRENVKGDKILASEALQFIKDMSKIEASLKDMTPDDRLAVRLDKVKPIFAAFQSWLEEKQNVVLPKSPTGKAISYLLADLDAGRFKPYFQNGLVPLTNNYMEAHIRPFVIGRKNWVFSATPAGAEASANLYSLVETAKANGIQPYDYLTIVFKELPRAKTAEDIAKLLPYNIAKHHDLKKYERP